VKKIFESLKVMSYVRPMNAYWGSRQLLRFLLTRVPAITSARREHEGYTKDMTLRRLGLNTDRKDFMSYVLRYNDERGMSQEEIIVNTMVLVTAGSETTATAMSGLIFHLSRSPPIMEKLTREIRSAFESKEAMTFVDEAKLPYLQACINEELRIYPPLPILVSRMTSPEGNFIDGHFVPGNVSSIWKLSADLRRKADLHGSSQLGCPI
jgi:cytochrome P450